ncbi:MAG: YjbQ family protein [Acaryochloridaceae cyanobacterium SU_2_1]|nr:YjbQ family protein [Acaryochloridaceae cyanobacterium SU_2_1]
MTHRQHVLTVSTTGKAFHNISAQVQALVTSSGMTTGLCTLFIRHTSASLVIQENADPDVLKDLETFLAQLVPEGSHYRHSTEGLDDMPAHIRTALTHTSEYIPICEGQLAMGTWQGIYVWEHRQRGSNREVIVHLSGQ